MRHHRARGLSLIELMIAILIGAILSLGLVQVYGATREAYRLSEGLSRVQESGRFAMDYLQRDIRMAGHFGCVNDQARLQTADVMRSHFAAGGVLDYMVSVRGYDGAPTGLTLAPAALAGSDSLVLRFLSANGAPVTAINAGAQTITVDPGKWSILTANGVTNPRMFGIADCAFADVFTASAAAAGSVTAPAVVDLARYGVSPEGGPATLYRAEAIVYYVGTGAGGRPALFRARINQTGTTTSEELVEGVENMQLRFGRDASPAGNIPSGYVGSQSTATQIGTSAAEWRRVGQVQVGLLMASPDVASSLQATGLAAKSVLGVTPAIPDDRRYRAVYQNTIALRNRLYGN